MTHDPMLGRPNWPLPAFMESFAGGVVEEIGLERFDERQLIDDLRGMGHQIADPGTRLTVLFERTLAGEQRDAVAAVHEGESFTGDVTFGDRFTVEFGERGLVIEKFKLLTVPPP